MDDAESEKSFDEPSGTVPQPTIGETSIFATEAAAIRAEVRAVMEAEFAEGPVALRKASGCLKENQKNLA